MIACLRGELLFKSPEKVVIDVGGVGYEVSYTQASHGLLPQLGHEVFLHIYTDVREDALNLYGFADVEEKEMFLLLIGVTGVGPKLALNILSGSRSQELATAIMTKDLGRLTKLPGVGRKTAERLCLELKEKVQAIAASLPQGQSSIAGGDDEDQRRADVISALVNLGYQSDLAGQAVEAVRKQVPEEQYQVIGVEELLRQALRSLA